MAFKIQSKIPSVHFGGLNEEKKRHKNTRDVVVSKRLVVLLVFLLASSIVLASRLAYIQLTQQPLYELKLERYGTSTYTSDAARGEIFDRNGNKLVQNVRVINAVYYAPRTITSEEIEATANYLVEHVAYDTENITARQKRDFFIFARKDEADSLVSEEERAALKGQEDSERQIESLILERLTDSFMDEHMDDELLEKTRLIFLMNQTTAGSVVLIEGLSVEEASLIGANASLLKGVRVNTDSSREYVHGNDFARVLGRVTTKQQGLPADLRDQLLALNYQNDSRVGVSGLELQYENLLRGTDTTYTISYDEYGNPQPEPVNPGRNGDNLRISIDWELQEYANELITAELVGANNLPGNQYFDRMFIILMDPNNGDIIVMAGKQIDKETGEVSDYAAGNYQAPYDVGSTTKGGTLYVGFKENIVQPGEVIVDEPIRLRGTPEKASHRNLGPIDDVVALARSSNVYMFHIALRMSGTNYTPGGTMQFSAPAFDMYRRGVGELGLGVKTGLDVSDESAGGRGTQPNAGNLLDLFIGQYDTYTNMQLAQYTATLANGGRRVQPRLLLDAFDTDEDGNPIITYQNSISILDDVSEHATAFERIQQGYRACVTLSNGLCRSTGWQDKEYDVYAKTGTAEKFDYNTMIDYPNRLVTGWGSDSQGNPQIVFSTISFRQNRATNGRDGSADTISTLVLDRYYEKYGIR